MLPSRAILLALVVMLLTASMCALLIQMASIRKEEQYNHLSHLRMVANMDAAENLVLGGELPISENWNWQKRNLFNTTNDTLSYIHHRWGLISVAMVKVRTIAPHWADSLTRTLFLAFDTKEKANQANLYLTNNPEPLTLVGEARLAGHLYLPNGGLRKGQVNGISFIGERLLQHGKIEGSQGALPLLQDGLDNYLAYLLASPTNSKGLALDANIPFSQSTVVIRGTHLEIGKNTQWRGNIIIAADSSITVSAEASLNNVILAAPIVKLQTGFRGQLQIIASKEVIIEENVLLDYPSIIAMTQIEPNKASILRLAPQSLIKGTCILLKHRQAFNTLPSASLDKGSKLEGTLYVQGHVDLKGTVQGRLFCQKFMLQTALSIYSNHILDGCISDEPLQNPLFAPWKTLTQEKGILIKKEKI